MGMRRVSGGRRGRTSGGAGVSGGGSTRPHNCMSPGCSRKGETERYYTTTVNRPHNCMSPGCSRKGEMETVNEDRTWQSDPVKPSAPAKVKRVLAPDPDPFRFTILKSHSEGGLTLAKVYYHGCTNYEGSKILLFRKDVGKLAALDTLDPHFLETDENGLLARFVPTEEGWKLGMALLQSLL